MKHETTKGLHSGERVEMVDHSTQGTIKEIQGDYCLAIGWDDGDHGHVHPLDVIHLKDIKPSDEPIRERPEDNKTIIVTPKQLNRPDRKAGRV